MSVQTDALLERARTEVAAATVLRDGGFHEQAVSRAYFAAFYAAEAALLTLGESRSKHSGVVSAFGRLVVKDRGFDREQGASLRLLFAWRNAADYDWLDNPAEPVTDPIEMAESFVQAVAAWIAERAA